MINRLAIYANTLRAVTFELFRERALHFRLRRDYTRVSKTNRFHLATLRARSSSVADLEEAVAAGEELEEETVNVIRTLCPHWSLYRHSK